MTTTNQILESIDQRLRDAKAEIDTLTAARDALDGRDGSSIPRPRASATRTAGTRTATARRTGGGSSRATSRSRRRPSARSGEVVPAGRLESLLSQDGGMTTSALAERTNGNRDQILILLRELESAGRVRRSGQRRGTRWHAITDEDRIRERAAELEARRKR